MSTTKAASGGVGGRLETASLRWGFCSWSKSFIWFGESEEGSGRLMR